MGLFNCFLRFPARALLKKRADMEKKITKVHIAPYIIDHCSYKDAIIGKIKAKVGVEVIEGAHPYKPDNIFV